MVQATGPLSRVRRGIQNAYVGSSRYVGSLLIGFVLAPVVPDAAVDVSRTHGWAAAGMRAAGVLAVLALAFTTYVYQNKRYRQLIRRLESVMTSTLEERETLVISLSKATQYRPAGHRVGLPTVTELLISKVKPKTVVLIISAGIPVDDAKQTKEALERDHLRVVTFPIADANDALVVLSDVNSAIDRYRASGGIWSGSSLMIDVTGGTTPMSLAMLRIAALAGAPCVYVTKKQTGDAIDPNSLLPRQFDPRSHILISS